MGLWKRWAQILHVSSPMPAFFSSLHVTEPSWLQNRQLNVVDRGSLLELSVSLESRRGKRGDGRDLLGTLGFSRRLLALSLFPPMPMLVALSCGCTTGKNEVPFLRVLLDARSGGGDGGGGRGGSGGDGGN